MRIWSLHPSYLDAKGLVALWRETLLAKNVLDHKTKGYRNHPQLERFKALENPVDGVNAYLIAVYEEATRRNYNFDKNKIGSVLNPGRISVTRGQIEYEAKHLLQKLEQRDMEKYNILKSQTVISVHPFFTVVDGDVESWEVVNKVLKFT